MLTRHGPRSWTPAFWRSLHSCTSKILKKILDPPQTKILDPLLDMHKSVAHFRKKFSTLHRVLNSAPLCIFSTLLHKSEENCFTNIPHPLTKTFCKQPCDWLINRGWGKFSTLWHIQHPTEPAEVQHPLGGAKFSTLQSLLKMLLETKNSLLSRTKGWWSQFSRLQRVLKFFMKQATEVDPHPCNLGDKLK